MYKTISYWTAPSPEDLDSFEEYYEQVHGPLAARVPGVQRLELTRAADGFPGAPSPFYRVAEMYFQDRAALDEATLTPEWAELGENAAGIIERFGVTLQTGHGRTAEAPLAPGGPRPTITDRLKALVSTA